MWSDMRVSPLPQSLVIHSLTKPLWYNILPRKTIHVQATHSLTINPHKSNPHKSNPLTTTHTREINSITSNPHKSNPHMSNPHYQPIQEYPTLGIDPDLVTICSWSRSYTNCFRALIGFQIISLGWQTILGNTDWRKNFLYNTYIQWEVKQLLITRSIFQNYSVAIAYNNNRLNGILFSP